VKKVLRVIWDHTVLKVYQAKREYRVQKDPAVPLEMMAQEDHWVSMVEWDQKATRVTLENLVLPVLRVAGGSQRVKNRILMTRHCLKLKGVVGEGQLQMAENSETEGQR
jgi:hypothetical protein